MKNNTIYIVIIAALLFFASSNTAVASENNDNSRSFMAGFDIGALQAIMNEEGKETHTGAFQYGLNAKGIWDKDAIIAGMGYTSFRSRFADSSYEIGQAENKLSGQMIDLIVPINDDREINLTYITLSRGNIEEDYRSTTLYYPYSITTVQIKNKSPIYSIGIGSVNLPTREKRLSLSAELRYIYAPDLLTTNGFFMINMNISLRIF